MNIDKLIITFEKRLADAKVKQDKAFREGNFSQVNKWTKVIVTTKITLDRLHESKEERRV